MNNIAYELRQDGRLHMVQLPTWDEQFQALQEQFRLECLAWVDAVRAKYAAGELSDEQLARVEEIAARMN